MEDVYLVIPLILFSLVLIFYDRLRYLKYPLIFVASALDWYPVVFGNMGQFLGHNPMTRLTYVLILPMAILWGKILTMKVDETTKTIAEMELITTVFVLICSITALMASFVTGSLTLSGLKLGIFIAIHVTLTFVAYSYLTVWLIDPRKQYYQQFYIIWAAAYIYGILIGATIHGAVL